MESEVHKIEGRNIDAEIEEKSPINFNLEENDTKNNLSTNQQLPINFSDQNNKDFFDENTKNKTFNDFLVKCKNNFKKFLERPEAITKTTYQSRHYDPMFGNMTSKIDEGGYKGFLMNFLKSDVNGIYITSDQIDDKNQLEMLDLDKFDDGIDNILSNQPVFDLQKNHSNYQISTKIKEYRESLKEVD